MISDRTGKPKQPTVEEADEHVTFPATTVPTA